MDVNYNINHERADYDASTPLAFTTPLVDSPSFGSIMTGLPRCLAVKSDIDITIKLRVSLDSSSTSSDFRFVVSIGLRTADKLA